MLLCGADRGLLSRMRDCTGASGVGGVTRAGCPSSYQAGGTQYTEFVVQYFYY